jgi:hypothetical protein
MIVVWGNYFINQGFRNYQFGLRNGLACIHDSILVCEKITFPSETVYRTHDSNVPLKPLLPSARSLPQVNLREGLKRQWVQFFNLPCI